MADSSLRHPIYSPHFKQPRTEGESTFRTRMNNHDVARQNASLAGSQSEIALCDFATGENDCSRTQRHEERYRGAQWSDRWTAGRISISNSTTAGAITV